MRWSRSLLLLLGVGITVTLITVQAQPLVSGDYPAYACGLVERELEFATCLFLQGACGDINTHAIDLAPPMSPARIDSWAAVVE